MAAVLVHFRRRFRDAPPTSFRIAHSMKTTIRFARFRFTPFPVHTAPVHGSLGSHYSERFFVFVILCFVQAALTPQAPFFLNKPDFSIVGLTCFERVVA